MLPFTGGGSEREIKAFRSLFQLAYDIGTNEKRTLPDAAAAVLEGEKQRANERLDSDCRTFCPRNRNCPTSASI